MFNLLRKVLRILRQNNARTANPAPDEASDAAPARAPATDLAQSS
jgi:hypothetical protein